MALMAGYFRRWYGNFSVTQNLAVTAADLTPYCITAPLDPRLPGGGGNQICGNYDINPTAFGQVNNLVTLASNFGKQTEVYDIYNLFNSSTILSINSRYGPTWLQPTTILGARLFKFGPVRFLTAGHENQPRSTRRSRSKNQNLRDLRGLRG